MDKINTTFIQAARRKQILAAAIDTIADLGYSQASLDRIAKRAQISKTTIPYYFKTKGDLVRQIIIDVFIGGGAYIQPQVEAVAQARDKLATFIRANVAYIANHSREMAAVYDIVTNADQSTLAPLLGPNSTDPRIAGLEYIFSQGQQAGQFRAFETSIMAHAIVQSIDGLHAQLKRDPSLDLTLYAEELVTIFSQATAINE